MGRLFAPIFYMIEYLKNHPIALFSSCYTALLILSSCIEYRLKKKKSWSKSHVLIMKMKFHIYGLPFFYYVFENGIDFASFVYGSYYPYIIIKHDHFIDKLQKEKLQKSQEIEC